MLETTSFNILQEFKKKNKQKNHLWVLGSIILLTTKEASCLCKPFLWVPHSAVEIAPTPIRVLWPLTVCIESVFNNCLWTWDSE